MTINFRVTPLSLEGRGDPNAQRKTNASGAYERLSGQKYVVTRALGGIPATFASIRVHSWLIFSAPKYGCNFSGMLTEPSGC
jgi:hypothetical protein